MFSKRKLKKQLERKLEADTPHLSQFEPLSVPPRNRRWLIPTASLIGGVTALSLGLALWNPFNPASSAEQHEVEVATSSADGVASSTPGGNNSEVVITASETDTSTSTALRTEKNGYFPASEETQTLNYGLRLKSYISSSTFEPKAVSFTLFPGFWNLSGDSSFIAESGENSANVGKPLSSLSTEAKLFVEGKTAKTISDVWQNNALLISELTAADQTATYHYYRTRMDITLDCVALADGQGKLACRFALTGLEGHAHYDITLNLTYSKTGGTFRFV